MQSVVAAPDGRFIVLMDRSGQPTILRYLDNTQELVDIAKRLAPRCLTAGERKQAHLPSTDAPAWCVRQRLWPYQDAKARPAEKGNGDEMRSNIHTATGATGESSSVASSTVAWPIDAESPDYRHLLTFPLGRREFDLTADDIELLFRTNSFDPRGFGDTVLIALRGAKLRDGTMVEGKQSLPLEDIRPDHVNFRSVIGMFNRRTRLLSGYIGETVSWHEYIQQGLRNNLMPTGTYIYKVGAHRPADVSRWVTPAYRLSDTMGAESGAATVLRSGPGRSFTIFDTWDLSAPANNIHTAYSDTKFSSLGEPTVRGGMHDGEWARFQMHAKTMPANARSDLVLLTGREASIAATVRTAHEPTSAAAAAAVASLQRLRQGSQGESVQKLQTALGLQPTGYFGPNTVFALAKRQSEQLGYADGIYSPEMECLLKLGVLESAKSCRPSARLAPEAMPAAKAGPKTSGDNEPPRNRIEVARALLTSYGAREKAFREVTSWEAIERYIAEVER